MLLGWHDEVTRRVCTRAREADAVWGAYGRANVLRCLELISAAACIAALEGFTSIRVSPGWSEAMRVLVVRSGLVEIICQPASEHGTLLPIAVEDDMDMLNGVDRLYLLEVSWNGHAASRVSAA